ncbi:hypothetical protein JTE90_013669 [Oedothorax gibbosus]|uniref:Uncharacterized protein n=1 Tax=Oedothorax gibbosus TaxID=931172 RepID=A0AAV6VD82_9ARAC|nr:hypothetical protein JTE90_013669 [Oedothorax gibbosus]
MHNIFSAIFVVYLGTSFVVNVLGSKQSDGGLNDNGYALQMFPKCIDFDLALAEKRKELIETGNMPECKVKNVEKCYFEELMYVKSQVTIEPSLECMQQLRDFAHGGSPSENEVDTSDEELQEEFV